MQLPQVISKWERMCSAIDDGDWFKVGQFAGELELNLRLLEERSTNGQTVHRDGLFTIGWQRLLHAPRDVRRAVDRYNAALRRISERPGRRTRR